MDYCIIKIVMRKKIKKIVISACELSADKHAANLAIAIKAHDPSIEIIGIGSIFSRKAGVDVRYDFSQYSTVGLVEPIRYFPQIIRAYYQLTHLLKTEKPDLFIPIDNQGFHLKVCQVAKQLKIPVYYFIAPQEWHWGTAKGGRKVCAVVDKILAIFPEEERFYRQCGTEAIFVGHPSTDTVRPYMKNKEKTKTVLGVFPGSRRQEIERLLPVFIKAAKTFAKSHQLTPVISIATPKYESLIKKILEKHHLDCETRVGDALGLIQDSRLSLIASGTIGLEHALLGVPYVVAYKFSPITYWLAQMFFKKTLDKITYMSIPNIICNEMIFPELLQEAVTEVSLNKSLEDTYHMSEGRLNSTTELINRALDKGPVAERIIKEIFVD